MRERSHENFIKFSSSLFKQNIISLRIIFITSVFCFFVLPSVIGNENGAVIQLSHVSLHQCTQLTSIRASVSDVIALTIACLPESLRIDLLTPSSTTANHMFAENVTKLQFNSYDFKYLKINSFLRCFSLILCAYLVTYSGYHIIVILDKNNFAHNCVLYLHIIFTGIPGLNSAYLLRFKYLKSILITRFALVMYHRMSIMATSNLNI